MDKPFRRAEELEQKRQKLREIQRKIEELYDQKPGKTCANWRAGSKRWSQSMSLRPGNAYDIAEVRQGMADVVPNKAAFDRWLLALKTRALCNSTSTSNFAGRGSGDVCSRSLKRAVTTPNSG